MELLKEIMSDVCRNVEYFIQRNLRHFASILNFLLPYMMYVVGYQSEEILYGDFVLPVGVFLMVYMLNAAADKLGTGNKIPPVPGKRFTQVDDDGEVSIENDRLQELILYTADLEDWMERKGVL